MRASVACDGQVSDNPKHEQTVAKGSFLAPSQFIGDS